MINVNLNKLRDFSVRGDHIRLDLEDGSITWRDLSRIEQDLPFLKLK